jgi:flagellar biogenesis protein FliO
MVTGRRGVARKLQILLGDGMRRAANLHILAVRLVHPRQRIVVMMVMVTVTTTTLVIAVASSHALVLTVSHGSPVANSHCRR